MKRLFIFVERMEIGGIEASLLGLLHEFDYTQVTVDLYVQNRSGVWMGEIPPEVNLLPENPRLTCCTGSFEAYRKAHAHVGLILAKIALYVTAFWYRVVRRMKVDEIGFGQVSHEFKRLILPRRITWESYDLALIFGGNPRYADLVCARVKAAWVHTDWGFHHPLSVLARMQFKSVDYVVNVSEQAKSAFDAKVSFAEKPKSIVIENVLSPKWMRARANVQAHLPEEDESVKILSLGRLTSQKNFLRAIHAAKLLKARGFRFVWLVVGGGEQFSMLQREIERAGVSEEFRLVGPMDNPYPYFRWCDLLVCTSDCEGKSVAVREAQVFAKPVVCTRFPTSPSQIEDGVDGILTDLSPEAVADAILRLIADDDLRTKLAANCRLRDYANVGEIQKILNLAL